MDPIEVEGPDGTIYEFPSGTDDATIQAAMAKAYPAQDPVAEEGPSAPNPRTPAIPPEHDGSWDPEAGLGRDYRGNIEIDDSGGLDLNRPQDLAWYTGVQDGTINPNMPVGTDQNPYVLPNGISDKAVQELIAEGVTFIDPEGRMQRKADDTYGLYVGAARPAINTMNWLENGIDAVGDFVGAEDAGENFHEWRREVTPYATQEGFDELEALSIQAGARPGRGGQVAGGIAATAPLVLATRNPWLGGAAEGALQSNATDARGLIGDTVLGGVTGGVVDATVRGVGTAIAPNINPAARRLHEQGVELSPGQLAGGRAHAVEDATTGFPIIGDLTGSAQRRAEESLNRVAIQRPLDAIGVQLPRDIGSTHNAIAYTQRAVGDAYDELLPQLDVRLDQDFMTGFRSLDQNAQNMAPDQVAQWDALITNEVAPRFNAAVGPANGRITGDSFKELESILSREIRDFTASASPHDRRYASAVRELQAELRDMLVRRNPAHAERLQGINDAYRQLTVLEDAANRAQPGARGRFSPAQLDAAAAAADGSMRRRASARGDALFQDLSEDASELMRRQVNDSGTTSRGMVGVGIAAALSSKLPIIAVNPWAAGALTGGALIYTRTGNRLFTGALMNRPEFAGAIRRQLDNIAPGLGIATAVGGAVQNNEMDAAANEATMLSERRERIQQMMLEQQGGAAPAPVYGPQP